MYERNAVVLERYFNQMFGYNMKNNIKTNFEDYCELVECLEKYHNISEDEDNVIQEYDSIANKIREIQKTQESLNKKNTKLQEERANILQNIGDNASNIQKKLDAVNNNIQYLNEEIKQNGQKFVDVVGEFNDKTLTRTECGRTRRSIEGEYNKKLNETLDNYQDIDIEYEKTAKSFIEQETDGIEKEIKEKMEKNGETEKTPFNKEVLEKAISLSIDIQKRETDIFANIYDKTNRLFTEIKNNAVRIDKHKRIIRDAKCKLEFISAIREYLVQFLDNERLTAVNGEEEHTRLMDEACKSLDDDLVQINNLYTLLLKESSKKITKKSYPDLYNFEYLKTLEDKSDEFDTEIKKLNLPVTVINPNHWRIEGMQKIFNVFIKCVTEVYDRDLTEFMPEEEKEETVEEVEVNSNDAVDTPVTENKQEENIDDVVDEENSEDAKSEIDKKIDMILGFGAHSENDDTDDDNIWDDDDDLVLDEDDDDENWDDDLVIHDDEDSIWDDEEDDEDKVEDESKDTDDDDENEDEVNFDIWGNSINKKSDDEEIEDEEDEDDWDDDDSIFGDDEEDDIEDEDEEIEDDEPKKSKEKSKKDIGKGKHSKMSSKNGKKGKVEDTDDEEEDGNEEENWEDKFVKIDKNNKEKKKKGFFDKFKR